MVYVPSIQALDHEMPWKTKVLAHLQCFLIDILRGEVLSDAAVVSIAQLDLVVLVVEQVVHIDIVHVALDAAQVNIICLLLIGFFLLSVRFFNVFGALLLLVCFLLVFICI